MITKCKNIRSCDPATLIDLFSDISRISAESDGIDGIISSVMSHISEALSMSRGSITIYNRKTGKIVISDAFGLSEDEKMRGVYSIGEGITGRVFESGRHIVVKKISEDPDFLDRTGSRKALGNEEFSFICVPVKSMYNEVVGALSVDLPYDDERDYDADVKMLSVIGWMISQAVSVIQSRHEEDVLKEENRRLQDELKEKFVPANIIGRSKGMRQVYSLIQKVSQTGATVLILGESGVGKELVAQAIHYSSPRSDMPFIKFNCAALSESLIESELFGHEKGAFTGAVSQKKGRFELADGGTIFLDEIGELSVNLQAKFLRVLQEREFERVGGTESVTVDVRVITATNRNLPELISSGLFREDLYYRLNVFPIIIPSLKERKTDIPMLVDHFLEKFSGSGNKKITRISTSAIETLMSYNWPGNVRELENIIERAVILSDDGTIHSYHLPPTLQSVRNPCVMGSASLDARLNAIEYDIIVEAMKSNSGNISKAAEELRVTERILSLRLKKYDINYKDFRN